MLLPKVIHPSWGEFLTQERVDQINNIEQQLSGEYNPIDKTLTLRFFELDLKDMKVVWLGQDVYPGKGVATGRAFEAGNIASWTEPFKQVSLKNIIRLIHKTYNGITDYDQIASYSQIKEEINAGIFSILPFRQWFDSLESQGVFFLNTAFTCSVGKAKSHKAYWIDFSNDLLSFIGEKNRNLHWFLWGNEALAKKPLIKFGTFHVSRHPMMCSSKYENDFLKSMCFENTKGMINWLG